MKNQNQPNETSYDELPYPSSARKGSHPFYMRSAAALSGFTAPPIENCRVIEIGCSDAGNMLNMALTMPTAKFWGIDVSRREIEIGRAAIAELGLTNITLDVLDVMELDVELHGTFDYIIAHGIFSWTPKIIRDKILNICRDMTSEFGVAFISYNTYPGCHLREITRDIARYGARNTDSQEEAVAAARETVGAACMLNASEHEYYALLLKREHEMFAQTPDSFIAHDVLETHNQSFYFQDFAAELSSFGLEHFSDSIINNYRILYPPEPLSHLLEHCGGNLYNREQLFDVYIGRQFRESLVTHAGVARNPDNVPASIYSSTIISRLYETENAKEFANRSGNTFSATDKPILYDILSAIKASPAGALSFDALFLILQDKFTETTKKEVAEELLECYKTLTDSIEFLYDAFPINASAGDYPLASPVARRQAKSGLRVTSLNHDSIELNPIQSLLLQAADGSRMLGDFTKYLSDLYYSGILEIEGAENVSADILADFLDQTANEYLDFFAKNSLFIQPS